MDKQPKNEKKKNDTVINEKSTSIKRWEPGRLFESLKSDDGYLVYLGKGKRLAVTNCDIWPHFPNPVIMNITPLNDDVEIMISSLGQPSLTKLLETQISRINEFVNIIKNSESFYILTCDMNDFELEHKLYYNYDMSLGVKYMFDYIGLNSYLDHGWEPNMKTMKVTYLFKTKPKRNFVPEKSMEIDMPIAEYFDQLRINAQHLLDVFINFIYDYYNNFVYYGDGVNDIDDINLTYAMYLYLLLSTALQIDYPGSTCDEDKSAKTMLENVISNAIRHKKSRSENKYWIKLTDTNEQY